MLTTSGTHLMMSGATYRDVGVDAYEIGTYWGVNAGCGAMLTDSELNAFFAGLPPQTMVRVWVFQGSMAINVRTGQLDWRPLDRLFNAAAAHGDLLIASLGNQDGTCDDGHWKDIPWYTGGSRLSYGTDWEGTNPISYWSYLQQIVPRYANSPALGMWEPINEPEATTCTAKGAGPGSCQLSCPNESAAASALRSFFDTVGGEIHALDPHHLVEAGFLGGGQCGTQGHDFQYVGASSGIDVLSYHDYYAPGASLGGDQWNGIGLRIQQAGALGKPIIAGEIGITAGPQPGCLSVASRATDFGSKISTQSKAGAAVFLSWDWVPATASPCGYDMAPGDPYLRQLGRF